MGCQSKRRPAHHSHSRARPVPLDSLVEPRHRASTSQPSGHMAPSKTTLLQGTLDLIVLQLLQAEATNGYDLMLRIQAISKDVLNVNAGSLYPALYRLEQRGWTRAQWEETAKGRKAKEYSLTARGRKHLLAERYHWQRFSG